MPADMMRLVLFQPEIAANVGAVLRSAACFGAEVDIVEPCGFPLGAKGLRRAAMDYADAAQPKLHSSWTAFNAGRDKNARLVLLTTKAEQTLWDFDFAANDQLILGQESAGVPNEVRAIADAAVKIPLAATARSLNVGVAGAVALAEARRQVGWTTPS